MPSNHLILCCPLLLLLSIFPQHQGLFQWVGSLHHVAKVLELQIQHQTFQWLFRVDFLQDWLVWSPCCPKDSQVFSSTTVWQHQFFSTQPSLWSNSHIHTWLLERPYLWLYSGYKSLIRYMIRNYFFPFCGLSSILVVSLEAKKKVFILTKSNWSTFTFMNYAFWVMSKKPCLKSHV